jgi:hypothetical protein
MQKGQRKIHPISLYFFALSSSPPRPMSQLGMGLFFIVLRREDKQKHGER